MQISIVSELNDDLQLWTFEINENDLIELMQKYDGRGASVLDNADGIADEIKKLYR